MPIPAPLFVLIQYRHQQRSYTITEMLLYNG